MNEIVIKSNGKTGYTEALLNSTNVSSFISVARDMLDDSVINIYKNDDQSCSFYSDRNEGRKRYWIGDRIPADKYSQPNSNEQELSYYSEIEGITQEWYYAFTTFDKMMTFVNRHSPISLNPTLETKMKEQPLEVRPQSIMNPRYMYCASVEITTSGEKTTSIYVTAQPEEIV